MKLFTDKQVFIGDYGWRHCFNGRTLCGTKPTNFLKFPKRPQISHAAAKLLWAISLACTVKQDRVTRRETVKICDLAHKGRVNNPCVWSIADLARTAAIQGYWRDLYRHGFIRQFRRTYAHTPGLGQHFDVVYELTLSGMQYLEDARTNTLRDGMGGADYPAMCLT